MRHISLTPFGRQPNLAAHLAAQKLAETPAPCADAPDKWALLRDVTAARRALGLGDRTLVVLSALISFYPRTQLADDTALIVFPSNAALSERAHGMAESTLRRHLAALVAAGLVVRHDSPNGKRYALRGGHGGVQTAFGFDLRPLLLRAGEIAALAQAARDSAARCKSLRARVVLALRDAAALADWGQMSAQILDRLDALRRALRRRLDIDALSTLLEAAQTLRQELRNALISDPIAEESGGSDTQIERHQQNSEQDPIESESGMDKAAPPPQPRHNPPLPLELVTKAAPDILPYARGDIRSWRDLLIAAETVRPMMGINTDAWSEAQRVMQPEVAATALACMLQDATRIRNPGAYLRALSAKAAEGGFSPGPMVMALLRRETVCAA
ncbi:MAG: replication initiation protein [Rhodobacteraceae bacterium]|nr:replication initiation protein [Paracoccaceae bacterium]